MKKILLLIALACSFIGAQAQNRQLDISAGTQTIINSAADTFDVTITGAKETVTFQYNVTKTSGTVAGTIVLYGSIDTSSTSPSYYPIDTITLTDASRTYSLPYSYNQAQKYRVITTGSGTQESDHHYFVLYRD